MCLLVDEPEHVAQEVMRQRECAVVCHGTLGRRDRLAALAWSQVDHLLSRAQALLTKNLSIGREFFGAHPELLLPEPPSCSVCFPRIAGVADAQSFIDTVLQRHGIALAPGRFFESPAHFRISLAGKTETLRLGLHGLGQELSQRQRTVNL